MLKSVPPSEVTEAVPSRVDSDLPAAFARLRGDIADLAELARSGVIPQGRRAVALAMEQINVALDDAEVLCTRLREDR